MSSRFVHKPRGLLGGGLGLMVGAGFVWDWFGGWLGYGLRGGGGGWGVSGLDRAGWFEFRCCCCLACCAESDSFTKGWGLNGLACRAGQQPGWPGWAVLFGLGQSFVLWGLWLGQLPFGFGGSGGDLCHFENGLLLSSRLYLLICLPQRHRAVPFWTY